MKPRPATPPPRGATGRCFTINDQRRKRGISDDSMALSDRCFARRGVLRCVARRCGRRGLQPAEQRREGARQLDDLPRHLQVVALQPARPDQHRQRGAAAGSVVTRREPVGPRPAVLPARRRRRPLLLGLVQPGLGARRRDRRSAVAVQAEAERGPGRQADPLAVQPRHRDRLRQRLHGHARRQAGRDRHEDRQARLGDQARQFREAHGRLHRRAAAREGQGDHRRAGRRMARSRADLRRRRAHRQAAVAFLHGRR